MSVDRTFSCSFYRQGSCITAFAALSPRRGEQHFLLQVGLFSGLLACLAPATRAQAQNDPAPAGAIDLPAIDVQGRSAGALADIQSFVSRRDVTGTKTDTPLSEIPQSVSVINREQLDRAFFGSVWRIAGMAEPALGVAGRDGSEGVWDGAFKGVASSGVNGGPISGQRGGAKPGQ